ncbi:unnamed protein product [Rotaria sp. Silwood2]|nr:unnamed protein product [Rotaria sp. Silwood2]CAF4433994.1 unnamed protein product [Rotaria sp. Silwood2]
MNEKIFLIVSSLCANEFISKVHSFKKIISIFVYCIEKRKYEYLSNQYNKIVGVFNNQQTLVKFFKNKLRLVEKQSSSYMIYDEKQKTFRTPTKESSSFLYFQLFKEILQKMPQTNDSKKEMINQCRRYYHGNRKELENIEQFELTYLPNDAIYWYTKDNFVHKLINKALRIEDIDALYTFRFFIVDLCSCITTNYEKLKAISNNQISNMKLFHGSKIPNSEIQKLKDNIGCLISANGFWSCSKNKSIAKIFAGIDSNYTSIDDNQSVLFEITIDLGIQSFIFTDISEFSEFPEEEEVLLSLGTVFQIDSVFYDDIDKYWNIQAIPSDKGTEITTQYIEYNRTVMNESDVVIMFGDLLNEMGDYTKSQKYFENLLKNQPIHDLMLADIYRGIGRAQHMKSEYEQSINNLKFAYNTYMNLIPLNILSAAKTLISIGRVYFDMAQYDVAIEYFTNAHNVFEKNMPIENRAVAVNLRVIGSCFFIKDELEKAMEYYEKALDICEKVLPNDLPLIASILNGIAVIYYRRGDYERSKEYQKKSLNINEKIFPSDHIFITMDYNNLAKLYYKCGKHDTSLEYNYKALEIREKVFGMDNQHIARSLNHIGKNYYRLNEYDRALTYYEKALNMLQRIVPTNHMEIAYTLKNFGEIFLKKSDYIQALEYFEKALEIYKQAFKKDHRDIAKCLNYIGKVYFKKDECDLAFEYYSKALNMWNNTSSVNHPDTAASLKNIGDYYFRKNNYHKALQYFIQVLEIYEKIFPYNHQTILKIRNNINVTKKRIEMFG